MQMALFLRSLYHSCSLSLCLFLSLFRSRSIRPFRALSPFSPLCLPPSLSFSPASLPSYIKQTVSLAALGDIALIFQHRRTGVMQCAAVDTLHEDLSLLKWAKSGRASLSDTSIYPRRTFLISGVCCLKSPPCVSSFMVGIWLESAAWHRTVYWRDRTYWTTRKVCGRGAELGWVGPKLVEHREIKITKVLPWYYFYFL